MSNLEQDGASVDAAVKQHNDSDTVQLWPRVAYLVMCLKAEKRHSDAAINMYQSLLYWPYLSRF